MLFKYYVGKCVYSILVLTYIIKNRVIQIICRSYFIGFFLLVDSGDQNFFSFNMNYISLGENQITLLCVWVIKSNLGENQKVDFGQKQIRS